ncbi:Protein RTM1 [Lachnellula suecica]|uniref:Protein RTM1 n=1 Tax=Lachnellula suecica TaxID=602035 RepID=A0A8T9C1P3_9HELO|nr:Protein RTM1 [Lachnellula suecica]
MSSTILSSATSSTSTASATASCTSAVPDKNGYTDPSACGAIYSYYPSFGAAILFSVLFGAATIMHIFQAAKFRKTFCWVVIMGCIWETASFALRAYSTRHQRESTIYTISFLLVTLAPILVNAFDYMLLGRMVHYYLPSQKIFVRASHFSRYFVWLDIIAFLVQLAGASILSGTDVKQSTLELGIHIYMGGIGLQQFFIVVFTGLAVKFHREMLQLDKSGVILRQGWKKLLYALYASLALISIRIIYRLIEYAPGINANNPLPSHEAFFYCLDALPMLFAVTVLCFIHPGHVLIGPESEFPKVTRKQKKAAKAAKKAEKQARKAGVKLLDSDAMEYSHETELEEGLQGGQQQTSHYSSVGGYQGYQQYGGDSHNN